MNAPADIPARLDTVCRYATDEANALRGRLVNHYAIIELSISRKLSEDPNQRLPMLLSQKLNKLKAGSPPDAKLLACIAELEARLEERNALAHGTGKVWVNRSEAWLLVLQWVGRNGEETRQFDRQALEEGCKEVHALGQRFRSLLKV